MQAFKKPPFGRLFLYTFLRGCFFWYNELMKILSIDPGFHKTGYAVFIKTSPSKFEFVTSGLITTSAHDSMSQRLRVVYQKLEEAILTHKPESIIMEQLFFFKNQKTMVGVAQAQGCVLTLAGNYNIPLVFLTPLQIKQAITGYGRSDKKAVAQMLPLLLGKTITTADDDEDDAIACGLAYCSYNERLMGI